MRRLIRRGLEFLPKNQFGDTLYQLVLFIVAHRRMPRRGSGLFNDYLFFLKTETAFDSVRRQFVSDKDLVKIYYRGILGADLAPRTLAKFHSNASFSVAALPSPCIIKPAHLSGCIYYDARNESLSEQQRAEIAGWFSTNLYTDVSRERNYRRLRSSVICEEVIASVDAVRDYKIFCYRGEPRAIQVDVDRHTRHKRRMYSAEWTPLSYSYNKPLASVEPKPVMIEEALALARRLAVDFEFMRVDVYLSKNRLWLGELTSVPENAHGRFESMSAEKNFSALIFRDESIPAHATAA